MKQRKLRIISDGTKHNTRLVDVESGEIIDHVVEVDISINASNQFIPVADIRILGVDMDIVAEVNTETILNVRERSKHE